MLQKITPFLFAIPGFAISFTFGESFEVSSDAELLDLIQEHKEICVKSVENDKIYLKSDRIYSTDFGSLLMYDTMTLVRLPKVYSDEKGCYIKLLD